MAWDEVGGRGRKQESKLEIFKCQWEDIGGFYAEEYHNPIHMLRVSHSRLLMWRQVCRRQGWKQEEHQGGYCKHLSQSVWQWCEQRWWGWRWGAVDFRRWLGCRHSRIANARNERERKIWDKPLTLQSSDRIRAEKTLLLEKKLMWRISKFYRKRNNHRKDICGSSSKTT